VLLAFALFGLIAGILLILDSQRYEQDFFHTLNLWLNYPTIVALMIITGENFLLPMPIPIWNVFEILLTIGIWTLIGFIVYCFYKVFTSRAIE